MKLTLNVSEASLNEFQKDVTASIERARSSALQAMADRFYEIVQANFGIAGPDRPWAWAPLADSTKVRYRKMGIMRDYASLELSGKLKDSVMKQAGNDVASVVMQDSAVPYASAHHYGTSNMPARRVFPVDLGDNVLPWTTNECAEAAMKEFQRVLSQ